MSESLGGSRMKRTSVAARSAALAALVFAAPMLLPSAAHALVPIAIAVAGVVVGTGSLGLTAYSTFKDENPPPVNVTVVVRPRYQKPLTGKKRKRTIRLKAACYRVPKLWMSLPDAEDLLRSKGLEKDKVRVCFPERVIRG